MGVVEKIFSKKGLDDHYRIIFEKSDATFKQQSLGSHSSSTGWWIIGEGVTMSNTYLDEYNLGDITKINYANLEYLLENDKITGTFKYRWTYRWYLIPFFHSSECKFTLGVHNIKQKYGINEKGKFDVNRTIEYTSSKPELDCTEGDQKQSTAWGHDELVKVRNDYVENYLPNFLSEAMDTWLDSVDNIYSTTVSASMDKLTFTLGETVNSIIPDDNADLMLGYNYTIKYNSKSIVPEPHEDISGHDSSSDLSFFFYEEFFDALLSLDRQTIPFVGLITDSNLPEGIQFRMKAKDFRYIIDGMQKFDPESNMEADCGYYADGNTSLTIDTTVNVGLPMSCTLKCVRTVVLKTTFDLVSSGKPALTKDGALYLEELTYDVKNFNAVSPTGEKVLSEYLENRIEEYASLSQSLSSIEYYDERFSNLTELTVHGDSHFVRVSGNYE